MSSENFGILFRNARKAEKVKAEDIASIMGCTKPYIYQIEGGKMNVSQDTMVKVVRALAVATGKTITLKIEIDGTEVLSESRAEDGQAEDN